MSTELTRRDFIAATSALVASTRLSHAAPVSGAADPGPVVLFQGDSVTDCGRDRTAAYANSARALGSGYPLLATSAALAAHPDRKLKFFNRGVSGNKVPDLAARWEADTIALQPDVLSVLIGVNDFWHKLLNGYTGTVQDYEDQYSALLDQTRKALPKVRLIVLQPFVLHCGAVDARWFPEFTIRQAVAERVAARAGAAFVPLQEVFDKKARSAPPEYWAADGVHPTAAGHEVIATEWRRAAKI